MKFEYLDDAGGDARIKSYGKDLKEAFSNSALGMCSLMADIKGVDEQEIKYISKKASDLKSLLFDFLSEILYLAGAEGLVFKTVKVEELDEKTFTLNAVLKGEQFDPKKHKPGTEVKAVTYNKMSIEKKNKGYEIAVTLDL